MRSKLVLLAVVLANGAGNALADQLVLEDGRVLSGTVSRSGSVYQLVNSNGTTTDFPKDKVDRWIDVTEVSPADAHAMMQELGDLVVPILTAPEPDQFQFLTESSSFASDRHVDSASAGGFASGGFRSRRRRIGVAINAGIRADRFSSVDSFDSESIATVRRDKGIDNVYIDEWARYSAPFAALEQNAQYQLLTDRRRNSDSLADFSRRPREAFEVTADALREALLSLEDCIDAARETQERIRAIPVQAVNEERDIQRLEIKLADARADLDYAPHSRRNERRVRNLENRLRKRISQIEIDAQRNARVIERKINDFARKRNLAITQLQAAQTLLARDAQQPMTP